MIANGKYLARAVEGKLGRTETNKEQVAILFQIAPGQPHAGEQITWYGYFTEYTIDRTLESLEICGWSGDKVSDLSGIERNVVELVVESEEYQGKVRPRVRWVNRPGSGGIAVKQALTASEAAAFDQRMKGALLARKQRMAQQKSEPADSFNYGANAGDKPPV